VGRGLAKLAWWASTFSLRQEAIARVFGKPGVQFRYRMVARSRRRAAELTGRSRIWKGPNRVRHDQEATTRRRGAEYVVRHLGAPLVFYRGGFSGLV